jgi:polyhydroxyalkanoate synthase subunit PhaC
LPDTETRPDIKASRLHVPALPDPLALASDTVEEAAALMDRRLHAAMGRATFGISPAAVAQAYFDWAINLASDPGRQTWLAWKASRKALRFAHYLAQCAAQPGRSEPCIEPLPGDRRFSDPAWQTWPFNAFQQSFLLWQQWLHNATTGVPGVSAAHERVVSFVSRQILDVIAPSNFPLTNPVVLGRTIREGGMNLLRGFSHTIDDMARALIREPGAPANPAVGRTVAVTPGKVVFRNQLIELIQYGAATDQVAPEPVLIVPAWIMKYYILDLSPENSLVRYLVGRGFTVFMISWRNPGVAERDLGMDDYLTLGVMAAIDAACAIAGSPTLHATGYCLGGTLLSIAAAAMARDGDVRLRTLSLFAAQEDFTEAGELTLFINDSQLALLDDMMEEKGYLDARQMAGAFQILRSNDLIWSHMIQSHLLGEREPQSDLMAWNADATRMPARMHSEYLRRLFLDNDLAEGRYLVRGKPVAISDIHIPIFAVGTRTDHVAPWRSVHKVHLLTDAEVTFVLTSGGHNAGIVSEPGHPGRSYRQLTRPLEGKYISPGSWLEAAATTEGSWWPAWSAWLGQRLGPSVAPPPMGREDRGYPALADAPGSYVLQE